MDDLFGDLPPPKVKAVEPPPSSSTTIKPPVLDLFDDLPPASAAPRTPSGEVGDGLKRKRAPADGDSGNGQAVAGGEQRNSKSGRGIDARDMDRDPPVALSAHHFGSKVNMWCENLEDRLRRTLIAL